MSLQFKIAQGGPTVPVGIYQMDFQAVEATEHEEYGAGLKFVFKVADGEHATEKATRITGAKPTPKNSAGKMIAGIIGRSISPNESVDLEPFVGKRYLVQVETTKNDSTRIATVMLANSQN